MRHHSRSRSRSNSRHKGNLKSVITEKPTESDLVMKLKWATAMLGTKEEISFEDMIFDQYIMGESQILNRVNVIMAERAMRILLMKKECQT